MDASHISKSKKSLLASMYKFRPGDQVLSLMRNIGLELVKRGIVGKISMTRNSSSNSGKGNSKILNSKGSYKCKSNLFKKVHKIKPLLLYQRLLALQRVRVK